jgi:DUF1009 family protein
VERTLGLMAGAGGLPALIAERARVQSWRVVQFAFSGATDLGQRVDAVVPSLLTEGAAVLEALRAQRVSSAVLCGRFSMPDLLRTESADREALEVAARAGSRVDFKLVEAVIGVMATVGVEVLDQRVFLGDLLLGPGCWSRRQPTEAEWSEIRRGLGLARLMADQRIGQTVVLRHGVVAAMEAVEGTTEAIRRGTRLGGPGAVIVKAIARDHDYRIDTPAIGPETIAAATEGRAAALGVEAGRVMLLERETTIRAADVAGLALVSVNETG